MGATAQSVETVYCFDAYVGTLLWSYSYPCTSGKDKTDETTTTPTVDTNGCVYTLSHHGDIDCFNALTGAVVWYVATGDNWESEWGDAGSPIVYNNMLILNCGGGLALDKTTGTNIWSVGGESGFGSPKIYTYNSQPILLMPVLAFPHGGGYDSSSCGLNVLTGAWLSGWDFGARYGEDAEFYGTNEFFCDGTLYQMGSGGLTPLWANNMNTAYAACLVYGDYVYGYGGGGGYVTCQSLANGNIMWSVQPNNSYSDYEGAMMASDGKIICLNNDYTLVALNANPTNYDLGGRAPYQMSFETYGGNSPSGPRAIPVLANGLLYCRDYGSFMSQNYTNYNLLANLVCLSCGGATGGQTGVVQFSSAAYGVMEDGGSASILVTRTNGSTGAITVNYATANGTATAGVDYTATTGTLSFASGVTSQSFAIPILNPGVVSGTKTVNLSLSNLTPGATMSSPSNAVLTITDDDIPGTVQFSSAAYSAGESTGSATIQVTRTNGNVGAITVKYATSNGGATAGTDYTTATGTLSFANGVTSQTFTVTILNNTNPPSTDTVNLWLSNPTGGSSLGSPTNAVLTIINDEGLSGFAAWSCKMKITFPGYNRSEALACFPAVVTLSTNISGFSYSQFASTSGYDLRFSDGLSNLNYEIEQWVTNGNSFIWVQVPNLATNSFVWAYWGNSANAVTSAPAVYATNGGTWANGYVGVWHMDSPPTGGSIFPDSTAGKNNGTFTSAAGSSSITGVVGNAVHFGGDNYNNNDYIVIANQANFNLSTEMTASAWVLGWPRSQTVGAPWLSKNGTGDGKGWQLATYNDSDNQIVFDTFGVTNSSTEDTYLVCQNNLEIPMTRWHYLVAVLDMNMAGRAIYLDGVLYANDLPSGSIIPTTASPVIGGQVSESGGPNAHYNGYIDEVEISSCARDANWIWASWLNVLSNASFNAYGTVQTGGVMTTTFTITASAGSNGTIAPSGAVSVPSGSNQTFTITGNSGYIVTNVVVDGTFVGASNSYTFGNVTAGHTINALFGPTAGTNYTITASAGSNGTITPSGAVSVPSGSNQTFTIAGNTGYIITNVFVDGSSAGAPNSYTFYNVVTNHTISAFFGGSGTVGFNAWTNRMMISFSGYSRPETLTNFPALVILSTNISGFSYNQFASTNGYDLCFSPSDGSTNLNYEIEKWSTNGNSCVWVQVPQLSSSGYIWAYWGNTSVASSPAVYATNGAIWPTNAFVAVWHMAQSNTLDSTANGNNGTASTAYGGSSISHCDRHYWGCPACFGWGHCQFHQFHKSELYHHCRDLFRVGLFQYGVERRADDSAKRTVQGNGI